MGVLAVIKPFSSRVHSLDLEGDLLRSGQGAATAEAVAAAFPQLRRLRLACCFSTKKEAFRALLGAAGCMHSLDRLELGYELACSLIYDLIAWQAVGSCRSLSSLALEPFHGQRYSGLGEWVGCMREWDSRTQPPWV